MPTPGTGVGQKADARLILAAAVNERVSFGGRSERRASDVRRPLLIWTHLWHAYADWAREGA